MSSDRVADDWRTQLAALIADITCLYGSDLSLCDGSTLQQRVEMNLRGHAHLIHPECAAAAVAVNIEAIMKALGFIPDIFKTAMEEHHVWRKPTDIDRAFMAVIKRGAE